MTQYQLEEKLGQGAMGVIYRAIRVSDDLPVAVKFLRRALDEEDRLNIRRFTREIQVAVKLQHPNIVQVYEVGEEDGQPFLAMELLEGTTVDELLARKRVLQINEIVDVITQSLDALAYLHDRDLIHRDLKPANIMVAEDGNVKLMDFGLVKDFKRTALTTTGFLVGSPAYLAPENIVGKTFDCRCDLFSIGTVTYECLTGFKPFKGEGIDGLLKAIVETEPESVLDLRHDCPPSLAHFLTICHRKNPDERFSDAREAAEYLRVVRASLQSGLQNERAPRLGPALSPLDTLAPSESFVHIPKTPERTARPSGTRAGPFRRIAYALGTLTFVILVGILGALRLGWMPFSSPPDRIDAACVRITSSFGLITIDWPAEYEYAVSVAVEARNPERKLKMVTPVYNDETFRARITGLTPGTEYLLSLKTKEKTLFERSVKTRSPRHLGLRIMDSVAKLRVPERLDALAEQLSRDEPAPAGQAKEMMSDELRRDIDGIELGEQLKALIKVGTHYLSSPAIDELEKVRLMDALGQLQDLRVGCQAVGLFMPLQVPSLSGRDEPIQRVPLLANAHQVRLVFTDIEGNTPKSTARDKIRRTPFDGKLSTEHRAGVSGLQYRFPDPIPLPSRALIRTAECGIAFEDITPGIRLKILGSQEGKRFYTLCSFRGPESQAASGAGTSRRFATAYHPIRKDCLGHRKFWLGLELVPNSLVAEEAEAHIAWITLRYQIFH